MPAMNMVQALNSALEHMLEHDPTVVLMGEDIGYFGGVFRVTDGLQQRFGAHRVLDSPITEGGLAGAAIGMGVNGLRPVVEIQFADYIYPAFDQVVSELARLRYRSAADFHAPVTIRTPCGGGIRGGQTHSQSPEAIFAHVSGIKVVMPSNPHDAKGLLISAIEDDDPVVFFEPKRLYNGPFDGDPNKPATSWEGHPLGEVPEGIYREPIGKAAIRRSGSGCTIVTYGTLVHVCIAAADRRRAQLGTSRRHHNRRIGEQDRPLPDRARGHPVRRLRRGVVCNYPGAVLLEPAGTHRARGRVGHPLPARVRVGVLPRKAASAERAQGIDDGGVRDGTLRDAAAGSRRGHCVG